MPLIVTNNSSRSFIFGELMILPRIPLEITPEQQSIIMRSPYAEFFSYETTNDNEPPPDTTEGGLAQRLAGQEETPA